MKRYRERNYAFGQAMLSLRNAMGLSQGGLAELLGVSRYSVGAWEVGDKYPKVEHLKKLITLAVQQQAFPTGQEAEKIRTLWQLANQKSLLDKRWLAALLPNSPPHEVKTPTPSPAAHAPRRDWGEASSVPVFYGRDLELDQLTQWVTEEHCRVVGVIGQGGIGKSALSVTLMRQLADRFDVVIWRSVRDAPTCAVLLDGCLKVLAPPPQTPTSFAREGHLQLFLKYLRDQRVLIMLDNMETLLDEGKDSGQMRAGYEDYERLLRLVGETNHQSCLLFTSREKPLHLAPLEGNGSSVRILRLAQLEAEACERLIAEKGLVGSVTDTTRLIEAYAGNPLALKIVTQTIVDLFEREIAPFLEQGEIIFGGIRTLLGEQFVRLSALEQSILVWLAIMREPSTLDDLLEVMVTPVSRARLLEVMGSLHRRSLIERGQQRGSFTLQSVILEYGTSRLIARVSEEIETSQPVRLLEHGLVLANAREYVRLTQERLIVLPILAYLDSLYLQSADVERHFCVLLDQCRTLHDSAQGYSASNVVTLLRLLRGDLRGLDLSNLVLRSVYLQGVEMQDAQLVEATIRNSLFTETFDAMTSLAISPTGEYWAGSSRRGELRIWRAGGQRLHQGWRGHADMIWSVTFSLDGRTLVSGSSDGTVKVWNVATHALLWSGRHTSPCNHVAYAPDGMVLASVGNDACIRLWDTANGTQVQLLTQPEAIITTLYSPDGTLLATADAIGSVRLWSLGETEADARVVMQMEHTSYIDGIAFSPDSRLIASAGWDSTVKIWDVASGQLLHTLSGHTDRAMRVAWSHDGRLLASCSFDQTVLLWDVEQERYRARLRGHTNHVYEIVFTPDDRTLVSSSSDGTLRVWDVASEQCVHMIYGYSASISDVDWSPDGAQLVSAGSDLVVTRWDVATGKPVQDLTGNIGLVCGVGWSAQGRYIASSESANAIRLWDLTEATNHRLLRPPNDGGNYMYSLSWSADGCCVASGSHNFGVDVWNVVTGEQTWLGSDIPVRVPRLTWSNHDHYLACGGEDSAIYVWNAANGTLAHQLVGHHSLIRSLAWSPDDTLLATGASAELFVWDIQHEAHRSIETGHLGLVSAVAWGTDDQYLISGGSDGTLRWWDLASGNCLRVQEAHQASVQSLRRSPDGIQLASCGDDGAIMLWDISSGDHLQTLRRDRPYERLDVTGIRGLTEAQKSTLRTLGAIENGVAPNPQ